MPMCVQLQCQETVVAILGRAKDRTIPDRVRLAIEGVAQAVTRRYERDKILGVTLHPVVRAVDQHRFH